MDIIKQGGIALIKSAITGAPSRLPEGFSMEQVYPVMKRHNVEALIYAGALVCGVSRSEPGMAQLFQRYCRHLMLSEGQMRQTDRLFAAFDAAGITYMPLKGCLMKSLYPQPELRYMGDTDVLIRVEEYPRIVPVLESLGFTNVGESDHELQWKHPELNVELHKRLIPTYNEDFCGYFGDGWQLATQGSGTRRNMSEEDTWLYLFTHFTKHFRDGGIGCRHVTDLWVYLRNHPDMDTAYIYRELETLHLVEFHDNIRKTLDVWFHDEPWDDKTEFITEYIFHSGSWGTEENRLLSLGTRNNHSLTGTESKIIYLWRVAFPKLYFMQRGYPILKKFPWLLPVVWVYRLIEKIFFRRGRIRKTQNSMEKLTTEKLNARRQMMRYVGLELRFK